MSQSVDIKNPIVIKIDEVVSDSFINYLQEELEEKELIDNYPVVYIHSYRVNEDKTKVYVGESNDVINRTRNHYDNRRDDNKWQKDVLVDGRTLRMYIIGHEHFNKSLTLDIENRLIQYMSAMSTIDNVNGRSNPQKKYYTDKEFDIIFSKIWKQLRKIDKDLFLAESIIKDSAIFKASPLHKLTVEQTIAKHFILERIDYVLTNNLDNQLILIQGDAGTGKTVLTSSTFYEILEKNNNYFDDEEELQIEKRDIKCCLLVNHDQQIIVYNDLVHKLNLKNSDNSDIVSKPTRFINNHSKDKKIDVAFVDEGHLLLTRGKQSYTGKNQLKDIMERAKVTVVMFDRNQVLKIDQYWEDNTLNYFLELSHRQNNYLKLEQQIRMINASPETRSWIYNFSRNNQIGELPYDAKYELRCFDTPEDLLIAIKQKARGEDSSLSRVVATYDWEYNNATRPTDKEFWQVEIGDFKVPWNYELERKLDKKEKKRIKNLAWAEQEHTINEIGSTFSIQGFDLSYVGVIIGPSVRYRNGKVEYVPENSFNKRAIDNRTMSDGSLRNFAEELLRNELHVLLTRGVNGLYLYATDDELREKLKKEINRTSFIRDKKF